MADQPPENPQPPQVALPIVVPLASALLEKPKEPLLLVDSSPPIKPPKPKPDYGMFVGLVGIIFAVFIPNLQMNGIEINWEFSALDYLAIIVGFVWTFLTHAVPHRGKVLRITGSLGLVIAIGWIASIATLRQYRIEHPTIPMLSISIETIPGLPTGSENNPHLRCNYLVIKNDNDIEIDNFYGRLQLPEPVTTMTETDLPPGTVINWRPLLTEFSVIGTGNRTFLGPNSSLHPVFQSPTFLFPVYSAQLTRYSDGGNLTGVWILSVDKIPPHKPVILAFLTTDEGDATNYIALANYKFVTNGASLSTTVAGDGKGGARLINMTIAFIIHTNKVVLPNEDWHLGTNELRFSLEGLFQYKSADKAVDQHFLVPFRFDTNNRTISSLPIQSENGKWKRVSIQYQ